MSRHIGILGGSFDPIHFGHINLALEMMEARCLDEVWFCPTYINPFKPEGSYTIADDRLAMLRLGIEGTSEFKINFKVIDLEIKRKGPSYTIDTVDQILASQPKGSMDRFSLLIGEDAAHSFYKWHRADDIIQKVQLLVGYRRGVVPSMDFQGSSNIVAALTQGLTPTRLMEISSTEIRRRLAERLYCGHLVPSKVVDYIFAHRLYIS